MASLFWVKGRPRIELTNRSGQRKTIRLDPMPKRVAGQLHAHVNRLLASHLVNLPPDEHTAKWIAGLSDMMRGRLARAGLTEAGTSYTLGDWLRRYVSGKKKAVKPGTLVRLKQAEAAAVRVLGSKTDIAAVTEADAERFRDDLIGEGLSEATVRKRCGDLRAAFARAVKAGAIPSNPFEAVPVSVPATAHRQHVSERDSLRVLDELPSLEWRLLFVLCRWQGLRIPSEIQHLEWSDVSWGNRRITIRQPKKTRAGVQMVERVAPLFAETERAMLAWRDAAQANEPLILPRFARVSSAALRTTPMRAIKRAGVRQWPKLWHNLRRTRQNELGAMGFRESVVCEWLGNTRRVADESYHGATEAEFQGAVKSAAQSAVDSVRQPATATANQRRRKSSVFR